MLAVPDDTYLAVAEQHGLRPSSVVSSEEDTDGVVAHLHAKSLLTLDQASISKTFPSQRQLLQGHPIKSVIHCALEIQTAINVICALASLIKCTLLLV